MDYTELSDLFYRVLLKVEEKFDHMDRIKLVPYKWPHIPEFSSEIANRFPNALANSIDRVVAINNELLLRTKDNLAALVFVIGHELGHIYYGDRGNLNSLDVTFKERRADSFGGFVVKLCGLSLEDATRVFDDECLGECPWPYPDKATRLADLLKGRIWDDKLDNNKLYDEKPITNRLFEDIIADAWRRQVQIL